MKLLNNLYKIIDINPAELCATVELLRDCVIYKAHFPEQPITPGVCIIQTATELFETLQGKKLELVEVVNAKFLAVINPDETVSVGYSFGKITPLDDGHVKVSVTVANPDKTFAKLSLIYAPAGC